MPTRNARPTIGYLAPAIHDASQTQWSGIIDAARERDVNLICFLGSSLRVPSGFQVQANVLYDLVAEDNIDGIVSWASSIGNYVTMDEIRAFHERYHPLPVVTIGTVMEGFPSLLMDSYEAMREALVHLVEVHGYRRLAFIRGPEGHLQAQERYQAYTDVLQAYGLPFDPNLVTLPLGWDPSMGMEAMRLLLDARRLRPQVDFQAVVAANDHLLLGALEVLRARGIQVPGEVAIAGFDDLMLGRTNTPPFTSVVAPYYEIGNQAIELLLTSFEGKQVPEQVIVPSRLVVRQSCGCTDLDVKQAAVDRVQVTGQTLDVALAARREEIVSEMAKAMEDISRDMAADWAKHLLDGFAVELGNKSPGAFVRALDQVLQQAALAGSDVAPWQGSISALQRQTLPYLDGEALLLAENLWQQARIAIGKTAQRLQAYHTLQAERQAQTLREISQALITTLDVQELMQVLAEKLPQLGIPSCYLSLYEDPQKPAEWSRLRLAYSEQQHIEREPEARRFPSRQLVPQGMLPQERRYTFVVEPLYFRDQQLGFALFEVGPREGYVYDALRGQISSALYGARLVQQAERRAVQLQAGAEVSRVVSSILNPDELAQKTVDLIRDGYSLYYVGLFMLDLEGRYAVLRAGTGEAGHQMVVQGHKLEVGGVSMIGWCIANRQARIALDVGQEATRFSNPLLPATRSELALPLVSRGQIIGAMTIQSDQPTAFSQEDITVLQTMADQVANAIETARLFVEIRQAETRTQEALQELERLYRATSHEGWQALRETGQLPAGYVFDQGALQVNQDLWLPEIEQAVRHNSLIQPTTLSSALVSPLSVRSEVIGALGVLGDPGRRLLPEDMDLVKSVSEQVALALENARLFEQTQLTLAETQVLYQASAEITAAQTYDQVLAALCQHTLVGQADLNAAINLFDVPWTTDRSVHGINIVAQMGKATDRVTPRYELNQIPALSLLRRDEPTLVSDLATDPNIDETARDLIVNSLQARSAVFVPLVVGGQWIGYIGALWSQPQTFTEADIRRLKALTGQAATVVQSIKQLTETQSRARREQVLREVTARVRNSTDPDTVMRTLAHELGTALGKRTLVRLVAPGQAAPPSPDASNGNGQRR